MTHPTQIEGPECRAAFEAWYLERWQESLMRDGQGYGNTHANIQWVAWKAAWEQRVPAGSVVVPIEPTEKELDPIAEQVRERIMIEFGIHGSGTLGYYKRIYLAGYRAMIKPFVREG